MDILKCPKLQYMLFNIKIVKPNELPSIEDSRYICVKNLNQEKINSEIFLI